MRASALLFAVVTLLALPDPAAWAQVTLPHYEPFNYTNGVNVGSQPSWTTLNTGDSLTVVSGSLSYPGLAASSGGKLKFDGSGTDASKLFDSTAAGSVYYSFLVKITAVGSLGTTGGYFCGFYNTRTGTTTGAPVWTRLDGTSFDFGISTRITSPVSWSTIQSLDTTYLIVASYTFVAGDTNDVSKLWINPPASSFGGTEPTPTLTAVNTVSDLASVMRIMVRQDSPTLTPFIELDELRIGKKWSDVTPAGGGTSVNDKNTGVIPRELRLEQNYPNPFNPHTTIHYQLPMAHHVSLKVHDLLGREVAALVDEIKEPGAYTVPWDASGVASGMYICRLTAGPWTAVMKMILTR